MILYINVYMIHMIYELMLHYPLTFLTFQVCARQLAPLRLIAPDVSGHGRWDHEFAPFGSASSLTKRAWHHSPTLGRR
jgi:hypothetical protein